MEEGRRAIDTDRNNLTAKYNQALYAMYAGDFQGAATLGKAVAASNPALVKAYVPMAVAAVIKGDLPGAASTYDAMAAEGLAGASLAAIGRADLALYTGRVESVRADLKPSIAADLTTKSTTPAAVKHLLVAEA